MGHYADDILGLDFTPPLPAPIADPPATLRVFDPFNEEPTTREPVYPWPPKLPYDLALGADTEEVILLRHGVTKDDYLRWALTHPFRRALAESAKDIRDNGVTFKRICAGIAEDFLGELDEKLHDPAVGFSTKMDAFRTVTKLAGLEPKEDKSAAPQSANMVNIQINI